MTKTNVHQDSDRLIPADYLERFRVFPLRFEESAFDHWYVLVIFFYLVLLLLFLIVEFHSHFNAGRLFFYFQQIDFASPGLIFFMSSLVLTTLAFNRWRRSIPKTFKELFIHKSLIKGDSSPQDYLGKYQNALLSNKRFILIGILMIVTEAVLLISVISGIPSIRIKTDTFDLSILWIRWIFGDVFFSLLLAYLAGVEIWNITITGWFIRRLTLDFNFSIQPSHPDRCGGFKVLGDFCFNLVLPILINAILIGTFSMGVTIVQGPNIFTIAASLLLLLVILPQAIICFFVPMGSIHYKMVHEKKEYDEEYAKYIFELEKRIWSLLKDHKMDEAKKAKEEVEVVKILHPDISYPVWPFNRGILVRFWTSLILPSSSILMGLKDPIFDLLRRLHA